MSEDPKPLNKTPRAVVHGMPHTFPALAALATHTVKLLDVMGGPIQLVGKPTTAHGAVERFYRKVAKNHGKTSPLSVRELIAQAPNLEALEKLAQEWDKIREQTSSKTQKQVSKAFEVKLAELEKTNA
jgi:hypothetical protein